MPKLMAEPLPPGCPWSGWTPPNVDWCEEELCSWVVNPADTWSNLAYIALGIGMMVALARIPQRERFPGLVLFGPASILVGIFSFVYHASYTYFFQFFDFVGMFVFCFVVITANALRLGVIGRDRQWLLFGCGVAASSALVPLVSQTLVPIQSLVAVLIATVIAQEIVIARRRAGPEPAYPVFATALVLLAAAGAASLADVTRTWCDPTNHWLQGHALWHLLTAASLFVLFHFYRGLGSFVPGDVRPA